MKWIRFTEEQIIAVLREHGAGAKTADLARKHGISESTLYSWKAKNGSMDLSDAKCLRSLEDENRKLKKLLAESMLDQAALKELLTKAMVGPAVKREAVAHLSNVLEMSERRACILIAADRNMIRYRSRRPPDAELRARLRDLANQRRRLGYWRLLILLREQDELSDVNRIYRLYREKGWWSASARLGGEPSEHARRSWSRQRSTRAGRSTSSTISSPLAPGSPTTTPRGHTPRPDIQRRQLMPVHSPRRRA